MQDHPRAEPREPTPHAAASSLYFPLLEAAVRELLIEKGALTADDLQRAAEARDVGGPAPAARVVARAWTDPAFRARLVADGAAAVRELGIELGDTELLVVENTPEVHNVVVCTLCSCHPRRLLGMPPEWYKGLPYRSRAVREPRAVLAEFGTAIPSTTAVRVHDNTADLSYLVLPIRPAGTEGLDEAALAALVTRESLLGVTLAGQP